MALDRHASDMMFVYAVMASGTSRLGGSRLTSHARTVVELLRILVPEATIEVRGEDDRPFEAVVKGLGL